MTTLLSRSLQGFQKSIVLSNSKQRANVRVAGQANVRYTPSAGEENMETIKLLSSNIALCM
jgi:hypothetical protein